MSQTKSIAFHKPKGAPATIEHVAAEKLAVDHSYQRSIASTNSQTLIKKIARDWDWRLCVPLMVSRRFDGETDRLFVIDGQHRLEAAKMRGDIPFLPCAIARFDNKAQEAALFVGANTHRRKMTTVDLHRAAVAAGDAVALEIDAALTAAGLSIPDCQPANSWKPGEYGSLRGVRTALKIHGKEIVIPALQAIAESFKGQVLRGSATVFGALIIIYKSPPDGLDYDELLDTLASASIASWTTEANDSREMTVNLSAGGRADAMRRVIMTEYVARKKDRRIG